MRSKFVTTARMICLLLLSAIPVIAQSTPTNSAPAAPDCGKDTCRAAQNADTAAGNANTAARTVNAAVENVNIAAKNADTAAGNANTAAEKANQAANSANGKLTEVQDAKKQAEDAAAAARKAAKDVRDGIALRKLSQQKGRASQPPLDDYVPCLFDLAQESDLRARPSPFRKPDDKFTPEEAHQFMMSLSRLAAKEKNAFKQYLDQTIAKLDESDIAGLSPNDVVKTTIDALASAQKIEDGNTAQQKIARQVEKLVDQIANPPSQKFERPDDVSCSFSVLGWQETSDVFGRRVANDYVAIQVNIRNLNKQNEFLIHDIQIAVDTGMNMAQFSRFQAGRDKLIVRSVAQRGQSEDRRNLILNTLQMVGNIAGGVSTTYTHDGVNVNAADKLSLAVAMFQAPFMTGLINIFPDHTLEHINHISDLVFSASSTNKTVVPVQGSVPLVTFLTEKPLEQMPFSRCGSTTRKTGSTPDTDTDTVKNTPKDPGSSHYDFCKVQSAADGDDESAMSEGRGFDPNAYTKRLHYKKWQPAALKVLERNIYVVIAGVHIQELTNDPVVNNVKCPVAGPKNVVDLSNPDSTGNILCTLNGKNLDRAASANLVSGANKVAATLQAAADGNSATLGIPAASFKGITASYALMLRDTTGKDIDTKQTIQFGVRAPNLTSVVPTNVLDGKSPFIVILLGHNLDRIKDVTLIDSSAKPLVTNAGTIGTADASTEHISVQFAVADVQTLVKGPVHVQFTTKDDDANATPAAYLPKNIDLVVQK